MALYFYTKYFPPLEAPTHNGVVKAMHGLASGVAAANELITILSEDQHTISVQTEAGYHHYCFAQASKRSLRIISPDLVKFIHNRLTPEDLVVLNGGFHLSNYALSRLLRKRHIPYIVAPHLTYDRQMFAKSPYRKQIYWHLCEKHLLKRAKAIQVLERSQGQWLLQRGIYNPIIEVQNGFSEQQINTAFELTWRTKSDQPAQILFFGRLSSHIKGLDLLVSAFEQLTQTAGELAPQLTLQGPDAGDLSTLQATISDLQLNDRVQFAAPEYRIPPTQIMNEYDIVCLPSRSEGFGLAALEGMLAGRAILVSETAGIARHVYASGCGIVVKPDFQSIQSGLNYLIKHRTEWRTMGLKGREYALKHLTWDKIAQSAISDYAALTRYRPIGDMSGVKQIAEVY